MKYNIVLFEPGDKEGKTVKMDLEGVPQTGDFLPIEKDQPPFQIMARIWTGTTGNKNVLTFHAKRLPKKSEIIPSAGPKLITP